MLRFRVLSPILALVVVHVAEAQESWMPTLPGMATSFVDSHQIRIGTRAIELVFAQPAAGTKATGLTIRAHSPWFDQDLSLVAEPFVLQFGSGRRIGMSQMFERTTPVARRLAANPAALTLSDRTTGQSISQSFTDAATGLRLQWRLIVRNGSNYVRSELTLSAIRREVDVTNVSLINLSLSNLPTAEVAGRVPGSPMVAGNWFFGFEHPMSESSAVGGMLKGAISRKIPLRKGTSVTYSAVIGACPEGQMRRGFARYVERERARPYRPFLHYNSWYDIGYFTKYDETQCLDRIRAFGEQLSRKRGVTLDSFLFDDGWDDPSTVWEFNSGFPSGFTPLKTASSAFGAAPGIWLSPWGGYGGPRTTRLNTGRRLGYEVDGQGYALSGPKYYAKFREACLRMVTSYGVNQFKLDGTGSPDKQVPGSAFASDFEAAIQLIKDLRVAQPQLFVNLTTGTWPSPFWTRYADSIWRGGTDHSFAGVGTDRQRWITYRDGDTYHGIVERGPLYPINSLMLHGLIYAQHAHNLSTDPGGDFKSEVRSYFATGTQLEEMYITPSLLTQENWDTLAEAANWARSNAEVLRDVHWVGGDPSRLEVYGWAAWTPTRCTVTLRNPSSAVASFAFDPRQVFELPEESPSAFDFRSPWKDAPRSISVATGKRIVLVLRPFEVLTLEGTPR